MLANKFKLCLHTGLATVFAVGLVACGSDAEKGSTASVTPAAYTETNAAEYEPGAAASTASVTGHTITADSGETDLAAVYAAYPALGSFAGELDGVDKVVVTESGHHEFYEGSALVVALDSSMNVVWSRSDFSADSIVLSMGDEVQAPTGSYTFKLRVCKENEQEQDQDQEKPSEEKPDQGQDKETPDQGQDKETPDQGQDKETPKEETCEGLTVVINFMGEETKQEQEQGKEEEKPDQEKPDQEKPSEEKPDQGQEKPDQGQGTN